MFMFPNIYVDNVYFDNYLIDGSLLIQGIEKRKNAKKRLNYCVRTIDECKRKNEEYNIKINNFGNGSNLSCRIVENNERIRLAKHYVDNVIIN